MAAKSKSLRGVALKNAIVDIMKQAGSRGISILEMRKGLHVEEQQHLDRRVRDLGAKHRIRRRHDRGRTFYVYEGPRRRQLDQRAISNELRAAVPERPRQAMSDVRTNACQPGTALFRLQRGQEEPLQDPAFGTDAQTRGRGVGAQAPRLGASGE